MNKLLQLSNGNPGTLTFLMQLIDNNHIETLDKIENSGIIGTDLYVLWSDLCGRNMDNVIKLVDNCPLDKLQDACSRQDYSGISIVSQYLNN